MNRQLSYDLEPIGRASHNSRTSKSLNWKSNMSKDTRGKSGRPPKTPNIYACVNRSETSHKVVPVAKTIAKALGAEVTLVHVIDPTESTHGPFDPVEWEIVRREARDFAADLASRFSTEEDLVESRILEGKRAEQLCGCGSAANEDITAICRGGVEGYDEFGFMARRVLETAEGSFLMVPASMPGVSTVRFKRVLVPLDGSAQAEAALPAAVKIAAFENAELVLVHATPEPVLTHVGPLDAKDNELIDGIRRRNERIARDYLGRMKSRVGADVTEVKSLILKGGDVRRLLTEGAMLGPDDLVVLASHGHSGFADVALGDVAGFIVARSIAPVLMIRRSQADRTIHVHTEAESKGVRRPAAELE
jgi:nucleotide-binding universal stress UspA family protein